VIQTQKDLFGVALPDEGGPVNVASVPHRSPFRYPGGKTWFIPRLREWLKSKSHRPHLLIEPFAGGGIVSLTTAFEDLADSVLMVEIDPEVAAVWETITAGDGEWLAKRILSFEMSKEAVVEEIGRPTSTVKEIAFQTIVKNRTCHGGILASGSGFLKNGEAGKGISSRWYPATLAKRLRDIELVREKLVFRRCDAFDILKEHRHVANAVFFIDPPYTAGGKNAGSRLYTHFEIDHDRLFRECSSLVGDFILTYDNSEEVRNLAKKYGFQAKPISMKNTHHAQMTELVIGKSLEWMGGVQRVMEPQAKYQIKTPTQNPETD